MVDSAQIKGEVFILKGNHSCLSSGIINFLLIDPPINIWDIVTKFLGIVDRSKEKLLARSNVQISMTQRRRDVIT